MKKFLFTLPLLFIVNLSFSHIIPQGATWKYLDDGSDQGTAWRQPGFDDNSWVECFAQPGYSEGDETAVLSYGGNSLDRYITYYFRKKFSDTNYFRKAPYLLYTGSNEEMMINWQMDSTRTCLFEYGLDTTDLTDSLTTEEYGNDHQHKVILMGLTPDTKYFYKVKYNDTSFKEGSFITGAGENDSAIGFYAYGDTRTYPGTHDQVAEKILKDVSLHPEMQTFIVSTGDLVENGNKEDNWQNQFFSPDYEHLQKMLATLPYVVSMGNHEGQGVLFGKYFPYPEFVSDRYYYSFDYGPAHFTIVDQFTSYSEGSTQYDWLVNDLATSDKKWKFILLHKPGWSAGGGHSNNSKVQTLIQPLCLTYGVQFVLAGHNHYYARALVNGVNHITTGGGGAPLYTPNAGYPNIVKVSKSYHYCKLTISDDTLYFAAREKDGALIEEFTVEYSPIAVKEYQPENYFKIYTSGHSIQVLNSGNQKGLIIIYDTYGRTIQKQQLRLENTMEMTVTGIYFVRIDYEGRRFVKKVFVR